MKLVQRHIERRRDEWKHNAFFELLAAQDDMGFLIEFSRRMSFWPLALQDVLRVVAAEVREPALRAIALHHAAEDRNLEARFLRDMAKIGVIVPSAGELFQVDHAPARRASYGILAEAIMARTDSAKIALLIALEAAGDLFFTHTAGFVRRLGFGELEYFSGPYAEPSTFEQAVREILMRHPLDAGELREALAVVDSCFDAIDVMFREILASMPAWEVRLAA
jgi:hypothetical protein